MSALPAGIPAWILCSDYAGLLSQALGLSEAAGLAAETRLVRPVWPWRHVPARLWPTPLSAVASDTLTPPLPGLLVGCGGMAAPILAALRAPNRPVIQIQHPRLNPEKFDVIVANRHDGLTGKNVIVIRNALHRVTSERLAAEAAVWAPRFAHLPRPLVAVLIGGANARFRLDSPVATNLARKLAGMMESDGAGVMVTPSRRTGAEVTRILTEILTPLGGWVWDGSGANPYFGMLALADAIVVTQDSVSMLSEAVATPAPVMMAELPGQSRRQRIYTDGLLADGRIRRFAGRLDLWPVIPINDTLEAAAEIRRRLRL